LHAPSCGGKYPPRALVLRLKRPPLRSTLHHGPEPKMSPICALATARSRAAALPFRRRLSVERAPTAPTDAPPSATHVLRRPPPLLARSLRLRFGTRCFPAPPTRARVQAPPPRAPELPRRPNMPSRREIGT
jgi:hypothetical protein